MNEHSSRSHAIFIITIECSEVFMLFYSDNLMVKNMLSTCLVCMILLDKVSS